MSMGGHHVVQMLGPMAFQVGVDQVGVHLPELIQKGTGLKVNIAENPVTSVALGLSKIIKDDNYKSVAYAIEGMSK